MSADSPSHSPINAEVTVASQSDEPEAQAASTDGASGSALWEEVGIEPVEIALPAGVGITLRAYRKASEITPTEADVEEDDLFDSRKRAEPVEDDDEEIIVDEEYKALLAEGSSDGKDADEPDPADFEDEETAQAEDEEVPLFLSHKGRLLAFKTPESLVSFIRSGAPHDLAQLGSWATLADRVQSTDIDPQPDDRYELDLVVENLRGGHDTWDLPLLIAAGEVARDLGHALRLKPVILALSPGSPLDDLDESLRSAESGGMGGFFGRRRLKKIGAQQASLGWRSVIGKISAAVDWRD
ncbi:DNA primase [Paractinoplanes atraurantiacus]|uniref:DNA primase n=1 Tax=Paractinoplanes atraurantiacus TaxID=1036182 RepID=UPI003F68D8A0